MTTTTPVAGWYPDPLGSEDHRYWDGSTWTEHTTPVVAAPAPRAAPPVEPAPTQPMPAQPMPVQALPPQAMPVQAMPIQAIPPRAMAAQAIPTQATFQPADPFGYRPGAASPGRPQRPGYAYGRPPGMSTGVKVLIGLAAAVVGLVLLGIISAVVIPVFLNERAKTHPPAGVAPAARSITTVSIPETAAGLTRATSPSAQQLVQRLLSLDVPGSKVAAVYTDGSGRRGAWLIVSRYDMSSAEQAKFLRGSESLSGVSVDMYHQVAPGPLGGQMQCAPVAKINGTACLFFDGKVVGNINVVGTTHGDALAVQLREAVEHRS